MLKELKNNDHGIIFITVLVIILTTMALAISALSLNISQIKSAENELKYIQARVLADGGLAQIISNQFLPGYSDTIPSYTETIGDTIFTIQSDITAGAGPVGSDSTPLDISVTF